MFPRGNLWEFQKGLCGYAPSSAKHLRHWILRYDKNLAPISIRNRIEPGRPGSAPSFKTPVHGVSGRSTADAATSSLTQVRRSAASFFQDLSKLSLFFFEFENEAIVIIAAAGANAVGQTQLIALRAVGQRRNGQCSMSISLVAPGFGCFSFGNPHLSFSLTCRF